MYSVEPIEEISQDIARGAYAEALAMIEDVVDGVFCEPLNTAKIFGSPELDRFCQLIGEATLRRVNGRKVKKRSSGESEVSDTHTVVYLVSKLQSSGGHTAALSDVIRLSPPSRTIVIVTGTCGRTDRPAAQKKFDALPNVSLEYVPPGDHLSKLEWLQDRLAELSPSTVWLFNHHQDSVAVAAVQPGQSYRVRFYHHGDHHLCLGVHLGYGEHFDPHPMGLHICRVNKKKHKNHWGPGGGAGRGGGPAGRGGSGGGRGGAGAAAGGN